MTVDRKTLIADAAIALLGQGGARGLTHRAVDAQAGLPAGSTSFYCRTRLDLLTLTLQRHAALDQADLEADAQSWMGRAPTLAQFVDVLSGRLMRWLEPAERARLVARFELFLIAAHEPDLAQRLAAQRGAFRALAVQALQGLGVQQPAQAASQLMAAMDGALLGQVGAGEPPLTREAARDLLWRVLAPVAPASPGG